MHEDDLKDELVKNNQYFGEAIKWHCFKFHYVFVERTWLFIFLLLMLFGVLVIVTNIYVLFPLKTPIQFVRYTDDLYDEIPVMRSLYTIYKKDESLQNVVDKYLISNYVEAIEGSSNLEYKKNYVRENSSYQVYNKFLATIINNNYKIDIKNIEIKSNSGPEKSANTAIVEFYTIVENSKELKKVLLTFKSTDILLAYKKIVPLSFIVVNYERI
jgi:type IV secretion system protein VirB8